MGKGKTITNSGRRAPRDVPRSGKNEQHSSWKELFRFYTKIKIPWVWVILTMAIAFAVKKAENLLVPYTSRIMTGAIAESGFLPGFVLMSIISVVVTESQGSIGELTCACMSRNVRHKVWGKLIRLPMSYYDKDDPQKLVSRITNDTEGAYAAIASVIQMASVLYGLYTNFMSMYKTYDTLAFIMLTGIPVAIVSTVIVGKLQYKYEYIINNSYSRITNFFAERLPNVLHIKTCGMEEEEYKKGTEASNERFKAEMKANRRFIFIGPVGSVAQYINEIVLLLVASAMVRAGTMQMYHLVSLYNYYLLFMGNAFMITAAWQGLKRSHGACSVIAKIINEPEENLEDGNPVPKEPRDIVFDDIKFGYEEEKHILNGVSFTVPEGKVTAVVGKNGSGKSTIIKLLERFNEPLSGSIRFGGRELREMKLSEWRESVGYLFQGDQIVKGSIRENLTYGIEREYSEEELVEAAKLANAYDFIMAKEEGFETEISRFDSKLSGGEQQRLAIARIILKQPQYLVMDEATSGIDAVSGAQVIEGLSNLMKGKTVIMVSHDMKMIRKADHIVVLDEGQVETSGTFSEVSEHSKLFQSFYEHSETGKE